MGADVLRLPLHLVHERHRIQPDRYVAVVAMGKGNLPRAVGGVARYRRFGYLACRQHLPWRRLVSRYDRDVLSIPPATRAAAPEVEAARGLVVEDAAAEFCGAVVECEKDVVRLEDRHGRVRVFPLSPAGFLLDGVPVTLVRPPAAGPIPKTHTASGCVAVRGALARVARQSRIYVEGRHDAELVEKVW